jgi:hypothetical protein
VDLGGGSVRTMMTPPAPKLNELILSPLPPNNAALRLRDQGDGVRVEILNGTTGTWASISMADAQRLGAELQRPPAALWREFGPDPMNGVRLGAMADEVHTLVIMQRGIARDRVLLWTRKGDTVRKVSAWLSSRRPAF